MGTRPTLAKGDLLESEPILPSGISAPPTVDCFALVTMSKLIVCLTNKEYLMASSGYQFKPIKDLEVQINLPSWIQPSGMVQLTPKGIQSVSHRYKDGKLIVSLDLLNDAAILVASNARMQRTSIRQGYDPSYQMRIEIFPKGCVHWWSAACSACPARDSIDRRGHAFSHRRRCG